DRGSSQQEAMREVQQRMHLASELPKPPSGKVFQDRGRTPQSCPEDSLSGALVQFCPPSSLVRTKGVCKTSLSENAFRSPNGVSRCQPKVLARLQRSAALLPHTSPQPFRPAIHFKKGVASPFAIRRDKTEAVHVPVQHVGRT